MLVLPILNILHLYQRWHNGKKNNNISRDKDEKAAPQESQSQLDEKLKIMKMIIQHVANNLNTNNSQPDSNENNNNSEFTTGAKTDDEYVVVNQANKNSDICEYENDNSNN